MLCRLGTIKSLFTQYLVHSDRLLIIVRAFNLGEFIDTKAQQPLPPSLLYRERDLNQFASLCQKLSIKLLRLFALGLKVYRLFAVSRAQLIAYPDPLQRRWRRVVFFQT